MSDGAHLLIPFASSMDEGCAQARRSLALPGLERLLARLAPAGIDRGDENTLSMPHERVLAREYGLPASDGLIPWAAWQVEQAGRGERGAAWAWITPCHWRVGTAHVAMDAPGELRLDARDSQGLLDAMRPFFEQDGILLEYDQPTRWLARGEVFRELATASLDRVVGRVIDDWMPRAPQARTVRRLQQEMQMLLYTHDINEQRVSGGLLPVNSFWVSGAGALPASGASAPPAGLQVVQTLREAALAGDWRGWAAAWQHLDATDCARLCRAIDAGQNVTLTLCGERNAQTWSPRPGGWWRRLRLSGRPKAVTLLDSL